MEGKKGRKKKDKKEKKAKEKLISETGTETDALQEIVKQKIPSYLTVQVGFGLKRSHFPKTDLPEVETEERELH